MPALTDRHRDRHNSKSITSLASTEGKQLIIINNQKITVNFLKTILFNPSKCSGVKQLHSKVFNATHFQFLTFGHSGRQG